MSALNLNSYTGIIYIVVIIVACLLGLWRLSKFKLPSSFKSSQDLASQRYYPPYVASSEGGKRRKLKRQRK